MKQLRSADPPIIPFDDLDGFMDDVFHNILDVRDVNRRLLEVMEVRQREQFPLIQRIGDVYLSAATDFRDVYADYVGNLPVAEKRLKDEMEQNPELRRFVEVSLIPTGSPLSAILMNIAEMFIVTRNSSARSQTFPAETIGTTAEVPRRS